MKIVKIILRCALLLIPLGLAVSCVPSGSTVYGIPYDVWAKLTPAQQQEIVSEHQRQRPRKSGRS